jgi:pimeloyl-ACP methyl ester carboxylesterase
MSQFQGTMQPWPALQAHGCKVVLSQAERHLYLYDAGPSDAPTFVFLHGLGDEADTWRHIIAPMARHWRVVAPDLPGFGRSDKSARAYTMPLFRDILLGLMDELSISRATLIGHSFGAMLSHFIALDHPERVAGLVLIGGTLLTRAQKPRPKLLLSLVPGVGEWLYTRLRNSSQSAFETLRPYYADLDGLPKADRDFLFQRVNERVWSDDQRRAYLSTLRHVATWAAKQQRGLEARLVDLSIPTLVIWGESDRMMSVENGRALLAMQPATKLVVVPGAGHLVQQEHPQELVCAIMDFFSFDDQES